MRIVANLSSISRTFRQILVSGLFFGVIAGGFTGCGKGSSSSEGNQGTGIPTNSGSSSSSSSSGSNGGNISTDTDPTSTATMNLQVGICRSDLAWLGNWDANQQNILNSIKNAGAKRVRLTIHHDRQLTTVVNELAYCNQIGLEPLLVIMLDTDALMHQAGAPRRGAGGSSFKVFGLSTLDLGRYRGWVENVLGTINKAGISLAGVEVGNEPNWVDFNGDFQFASGGFIYDETNSTWGSLGNIGIGAQKMGEAYIITRDMVRALFGADTSVILGGLNKVPLNWVAAFGASHMTPEAWLKLMEGTYPGQPTSRNYLNDIEAFAYHFYPEIGYSQPATVRRKSAEYARWLMNPCLEMTGRSKPVWITEFGYPSTGFEGEDWKRTQMYNWFLDAMAEDPGLFDLNWEPTYLYSWDDSPFEMSRNGVAMEAAGVFGWFWR